MRKSVYAITALAAMLTIALFMRYVPPATASLPLGNATTIDISKLQSTIDVAALPTTEVREPF